MGNTEIANLVASGELRDTVDKYFPEDPREAAGCAEQEEILSSSPLGLLQLVGPFLVGGIGFLLSVCGKVWKQLKRKRSVSERPDGENNVEPTTPHESADERMCKLEAAMQELRKKQ